MGRATDKGILALKRVVVAIGVVLLLFLVLLSQACFVPQDVSKPPPVLERAQVLVGGDAYQKHLFFSGSQLGDTSQILAGWPADRENAALVIVGNQGAQFLSDDGTLKKYVRFSQAHFCPIQAVPLNKEGNFGFLTRDPTWACAVVLYDRDGNQLWSYSSSMGVDDAAGGFMSNASTSVFVVGLNGWGGIRLLDQKGKEVWKQAGGNIWHVEILDAAGDGNGKILNSDARGELVSRNDKGEVTLRYETGGYVSNFALVRWGEERHPTHVLFYASPTFPAGGTPRFRVIDSNGQRVAQLEAPLGDLLHRLEGTSVSFKKETATFAALQGDEVIKRSLLYLFDVRGKMVYQEVITEGCRGIAALPRESEETLLVGCNNKVWEYRPAGSAARSKPVKQ